MTSQLWRDGGYVGAYIGLYYHIRLRAITQVSLTSHLHPMSQDIRYIGHITYIFFNIHSCTQCEILAHT